MIPIGICPASSQESAVQSVETLEQDGRKIHARPQSRQKSRCCRGFPVPFPRWHNLAIGYSYSGLGLSGFLSCYDRLFSIHSTENDDDYTHQSGRSERQISRRKYDETTRVAQRSGTDAVI